MILFDLSFTQVIRDSCIRWKQLNFHSNISCRLVSRLVRYVIKDPLLTSLVASCVKVVQGVPQKAEREAPNVRPVQLVTDVRKKDLFGLNHVQLTLTAMKRWFFLRPYPEVLLRESVGKSNFGCEHNQLFEFLVFASREFSHKFTYLCCTLKQNEYRYQKGICPHTYELYITI